MNTENAFITGLLYHLVSELYHFRMQLEVLLMTECFSTIKHFPQAYWERTFL